MTRQEELLLRSFQLDLHLRHFLEGEFDPWIDDPWTYDQDDYDEIKFNVAKEHFLERKKENGCSENTLRTYCEVLGLLASEVGGEKLLGQLNSKEIRAFIRDSELAKATQHKRFGHLRTFFRWCGAERLLRQNPLDKIETPERPDKLPKAITKEELQRLCDQIRMDYERLREKNWIREGQNVWRIPLFWFAFYTGMRGSEIARLRWEHIDFDKGLIYIREQKNRKEQTIPLNSKARKVLEDVERGDPDDYVFQSRSFEGKNRNAKWFRENVSDAFRTARKDAGLREELSFHSLRHGFCTALAEAGKSAVVIKEAARHADISTSMRYVHMANERLKYEVEGAF